MSLFFIHRLSKSYFFSSRIFGFPQSFPLALSEASPAIVLIRISSFSNSANAASV